MNEEGTKIEVTVIGAITLWTLGAAMLGWSTMAHGLEEVASRWALFVTAGAATWTVMIGVRYSRRRVIRAIQYELQLLRDDDERDRQRRFEVV